MFVVPCSALFATPRRPCSPLFPAQIRSADAETKSPAPSSLAAPAPPRKLLCPRRCFGGFFGLQNLTNSKPRFLSMSDNGDIHDDNQHPHQLPLSTIFDDRGWSQTYIVGICNGAAIVCLHTKPPMTRNRYIQRGPLAKYAVYNPFTRQTSLVRLPPRAKNTSSARFPLLAFNPRISFHRFKVVTLKETVLFVYSWETKKWRPLRSQKPTNFCSSFGPGSYCMDGKAYKLPIVHSRGRDVIMVFDVKSVHGRFLLGGTEHGAWKCRMIGEFATLSMILVPCHCVCMWVLVRSIVHHSAPSLGLHVLATDEETGRGMQLNPLVKVRRERWSLKFCLIGELKGDS